MGWTDKYSMYPIFYIDLYFIDVLINFADSC